MIKLSFVLCIISSVYMNQFYTHGYFLNYNYSIINNNIVKISSENFNDPYQINYNCTEFYQMLNTQAFEFNVLYTFEGSSKEFQYNGIYFIYSMYINSSQKLTGYFGKAYIARINNYRFDGNNKLLTDIYGGFMINIQKIYLSTNPSVNMGTDKICFSYKSQSQTSTSSKTQSKTSTLTRTQTHTKTSSKSATRTYTRTKSPSFTYTSSKSPTRTPTASKVFSRS